MKSSICNHLIFYFLIIFTNNTYAERKFDARILTSKQSDVEIFEPPTKVTFHDTPNDDMQKERNVQVYPPGPPPGGYPPGYYPPGLSPIIYSSIKLDVSVGTKLTIKPGEAARLTYDVLNLRDVPLPVVFTATDTLGLIRYIQPTRVTLPPRGTSRTTVELLPTRPEGSEGLINTVTLIAQAGDGSNVARAAAVRVDSDPDDDKWAPHCYFTVPSGQCREFSSQESACGAAGWNAEVTVRDDLSGLLRVESSPPESVLQNRYVAGTRAPVDLLVVSSCCQETVTIKVWDANGNSRTCEAYVYGLTGAEIAAIVLGCVLLVVLIIVIILAICLCRRRRRLEIPRRPS